MAGLTGMTMAKIALKMMYEDIMDRGSPHITKDFEAQGYAVIIFRIRVQMPNYQIIVVDTHLANRSKDRALFKTETGRNHLLQSLPKSARKKIYDKIMEQGNKEITSDLGLITFFCELKPDGTLNNSFTTISNNTTKKSEPIQIDFAESKP